MLKKLMYFGNLPLGAKLTIISAKAKQDSRRRILPFKNTISVGGIFLCGKCQKSYKGNICIGFSETLGPI